MKRSSCVVPLLILAFGVGSTTATAQEAPRLDVATMSRPIEALDNVWIEELTMMEVRDALAEGKTTALILTGGIEQNGPVPHHRQAQSCAARHGRGHREEAR